MVLIESETTLGVFCAGITTGTRGAIGEQVIDCVANLPQLVQVSSENSCIIQLDMIRHWSGLFQHTGFAQALKSVLEFKNNFQGN